MAEFWVEFRIRRGEVFGENARFCNWCHEVCIARPAWQQVNVQVVGDARARRSSEIHSHVEPRRLVNLTQRCLRTFRLIHQIVSDLFWRRIKLTRMQVRNDHHMPADIWVEIQHDKTMLRAMQHEVLRIVPGVARYRAEHTNIILRINT